MPHAHGYRVHCCFLGTYDGDIRDLLHLGIADLCLHLLSAEIHLGPDATFKQLGGDCPGILLLHIRDGDHLDLHGSKPERKCSSILLDERTEEPFHGTQHDAVQHDRSVFLAVFGDVGDVETLWQIEVDLKCRPLPLAANGVHKLHIDLWPIEDTFPWVDLVVEMHVLKSHPQSLGRHLPAFSRSDRVFRAGAEVDVVLREPERLDHVTSEVEHSLDLSIKLVRADEEVSIVLSEPTHAQKSMEDSRLLVAIHGAQLGPPERKITIAANLRLVNKLSLIHISEPTRLG